MATVTKDALALALREEMKSKPLEKITIQDLTGRCGINRQTFYYHFKDIYDLLDYILYQETMKAIQDNITIDNWETGMNAMYKLMKEEESFAMQCFHSVSRQRQERYFYRFFETLILNAIDDTAAGMSLTQQDKQLLADFYKHAFTGLILDWLSSGMKEEPDDITRKIQIIARDGFISAITAFMKPQNSR